MSDLHVITDTQGDKEWLQARIGCLTASRIAEAIAKRKRNPSEPLQSRTDLCMDLAVERLTNEVTEHYISEPMKHGIEWEPIARAAYEQRAECIVDQTGFLLHPSIAWAGCSPDGTIGEHGLVELKCPTARTHGEYILAGCVPSEYEPQMMFQMACCPARQWNDFVSYHPRFPKPLDLFICRLPRDEKRIAEMEFLAIEFLREVDLLVTRLKYGLEGALKASLAGKA